MLPKIALAAILALVVAGCPLDPQADRTAVTNELREACYLLTDAEIHTMLVTVEQLYLQDFPYDQLVIFGFESCGYDTECSACMTAAIDQFYRY